MVTAKTSTSASENHSAQRIVISPLHFPSQRAAIPATGAEPSIPLGQLTTTSPSWGYRLGAGTSFQRWIEKKFDQLTGDWVGSVTNGRRSSRPVSASILAGRLRGASWTCNETLCSVAFCITSMSSPTPALLR
jgi:hypothetical protein